MARFGGQFEGEKPGEFTAPHSVATDSRGDVYVSEVSWTAKGSLLSPPREIRSLRNSAGWTRTGPRVTDGEVGFNPFLPEFHADPYPFYRRLREADPVHLSSLGLWVLTRYDDCVTCLRDPRFGRDGFELLLAQFGEGSGKPLPRSMLFRDPPDHTRLRSLVNRAFTPRVIEGLRSRHPGHRGPTPGPGAVPGRDGRDRRPRLSPAGHGDLRHAGRPRRRPRADQGVVVGHHPEPGRHRGAVRQTIVARGRVGREGIADYFRGLLPERRRNPRADLLS